MSQLGLRDAATKDERFQEAGFRPTRLSEGPVSTRAATTQKAPSRLVETGHARPGHTAR